MPLPILLAHGIARFDFLARKLDLADGEGNFSDATHYFRRVRSALIAEGFDVHHSDVSFAGGVGERSVQLRQNVAVVLAKTGAKQLHIIAHSMGGLDARHMLFDGQDRGVHHEVASVTTIGTPHLGTSFADWGIRHANEVLRLLAFAGIDSLNGFKDLTTDSCREFDAKARAFEASCGVLFQTVAGAQELELVFAPLQIPWFIIHEVEGANDGLVPLHSARWRDELVIKQIDADHLNQIGWWDVNEMGLAFFPSLADKRRSRRQVEHRIRELYLEIARDLARRFP